MFVPHANRYGFENKIGAEWFGDGTKNCSMIEQNCFVVIKADVIKSKKCMCNTHGNIILFSKLDLVYAKYYECVQGNEQLEGETFEETGLK